MGRPRCKCGKVAHASMEAALIARRRVKNVAMDVYRCEHGPWHLGRTRDPLRCAWRIDQILERHARKLANRLKKYEGNRP